MSEMTKEQVVEELGSLIEMFEKDEFEGILIYLNSVKNNGWMQSVKGNVEDRLMLVHAAVRMMQDEPIKESRDWFFTQLSLLLTKLVPRQYNEVGVR